ncbi:ATP-dependent RNA helicase HrpA [Trueperella sp. LYQ141]|uniref:ATP-dependent RNA helicase HrpA n=1 Tax=Trueperella sp. LYQ141 TaxID=3391058 RepID=UPI003983BADD
MAESSHNSQHSSSSRAHNRRRAARRSQRPATTLPAASAQANSPTSDAPTPTPSESSPTISSTTSPATSTEKPPVTAASRAQSQRSTSRSRAYSRPRRLTNEHIAARRAAVPSPITYPAELPVSARRADIAEAIKNNQVVIIAGETGSGKTTQLPKICLELGRGITGMIGHTQPRRIAARSVAERICAELGVTLGESIGYHVRFTQDVSPTTLVKLMTDGILLAETQSDPLLRAYDTIIIDEAHERSLNIDFLLGYLARLLPQRPDLKLIITSATIDAERFAEHFGQHCAGGKPGQRAPIIEVSGRTYPVEIRYRPLHDPDSEEEPRDQISGIIAAADELMAEGPGDILVFLSGEGEIHDTDQAFCEELGPRYLTAGTHSRDPQAVEILPLFARLSGAEQRRIFAPHSHRRIVLATNIAETSLTVPGIRYVIDAGTARISRYSQKTKVQRLPIEPISQASANQRSGRCGRVADGIAIRLYSEADYQSRPEFTEPEILRTSLASVILQMLSMRLGSVSEFPFIDPPQLRAVRSGLQLLEEIGAIRGEHRLTRIGRTLAQLPIDPRLGRMLLAAVDNGCASEVLVLVAAMSVQDVRERPAEFRAQADQLHARFTEGSSDFLAYLNLWRYLRTQQRDLSGSAFRRMCRAEYINWLRFREWQDVVDQLRQLAHPLGMKLRPITLPSRTQITRAAHELIDTSHNRDVTHAVHQLGQSRDTPAADAIHQSLLVGLLSNLGSWDDRVKDYAGARGTHFVIWPGSGLHRSRPAWVMAAELVETSRLFARTVARIEPKWIEQVAAHLIKHQYSEPFWSTRSGAAMVHEKATIYGLPIVADRHRLLSSVGTDEARHLARDMFIRHGLVEGLWRTHHTFAADNLRALEKARDVEQRLRRTGLVADELAQFTFFDERLPEHIVSGQHFDSWWKKEQRHSPDLLTFTQEFLLGNTSVSEEEFPTHWVCGEFRLPIEYTFSPGSHSDGLTIDVPVTILPQLRDDGFDWLVPGMREDLIIATIRALPKNIRRHLVPAPDVARELARRLTARPHTGEPAPCDFQHAITQAVRELRHIDIDPQVWNDVIIPPHLCIQFRIRSERGAVLDEGPSLSYLQRALAPRTRSAVETVVRGAVAQALEEQRQVSSSGSSDASKGLAALPRIPMDELHQWPQADSLPLTVESRDSSGAPVRGYPALVDNGATANSVSIRVLTDPARQTRDHRLGIIRLLAADLALPDARVSTRWNGTQSLLLASTPYPTTAELIADIQFAACRNIADKWGRENHQGIGTIRERSQFEALRSYVRLRLEDEIYRIVNIVAKIMSALSQTDSALRAHSSTSMLNTVTDERDHLAQLLYPGFISGTPEEYLAHLPRYIHAAQLRLAKAATQPDTDDELADHIDEITEFVNEQCAQAREESYDAQRERTCQQAQWMIEELRVSLFAQQLGTAMKVSPQRIRKLFR